LRPILLLSSVCALLLVINCANFSVKSAKSAGIEGYKLSNSGCISYINGVSQDFNYNLYNLLILRGQSYKRFRHIFGSIRATGAEIWPVKGLRKIWTYFYEPEKCAVEHVLGSDKKITQVVITFLMRYRSRYRVYVESGISRYQYRYRYRYQNQYRNFVILAIL
jgi:hypothetical protein